MFDDLFKGLQDFVVSKVQEAAQEIEQFFVVPEAQEPFVLVRRFTSDEPTVETEGITAIADAGWQIVAYGSQSMLLSMNEPIRQVVLFELAEPTLPDCILVCRFQARAVNTQDSITVKLGRSEASQIGNTTRYWSTNVAPSDDFKAFELRAHFKRTANLAKVIIAMDFASNGVLEIKNMEVLQAPVKVKGESNK
jgi:hypothetical protein